MKVNQTGLDQVRPADRKAAGKLEGTSGARSPEAGGKGRDRVEWSATAQEAVRRLQDLPEVRTERVAAITRRVREGSYHVPADEVARKLIDFFRRDRP